MTQDDKLIFEDDELVFQDEDPGLLVIGTKNLKPWKVMIVDDDDAVHSVTTLALESFTFDDRELEFLHAHSGAQARDMILEHPDTAIILLDVVMETDHAGLYLVEYIREEANNKNVRIVLRTGQPGQAPEKNVIRKYDINDYKEKTELTSQKLYTLMYASLRSYRDIIALEENKRGLERVIQSSADIFGLKNMGRFTEGVLTQLTSLLHLGADAAYLKTEGLALQPKGDDLQILAGTGAYKQLVGQDARLNLSSEILADIHDAIESGQNFYREDRFAGYFSSLHGSDNILYLTGLKPMSNLDKSLMEIFARNIGIAYENIDLHQEIEETQREIVYLLGEAVEKRSKETGNHVKRVAEISKLLALEYGLDEEEAEVLRLASPLHDVGKVGIPDAILNKPGKHTPVEWEIMKTHAILGYDMLKSSRKRILKAGAIIARDHHEKWAGGGYPADKSGKEIHVYGRITAIADVFDALGNERCYKKAWPQEQIIQFLTQESGIHFEPKLVDLLLENMGKISLICNAYKELD
jgi:response regulator RpfG family c-di-GMP phosphodiesterase